MPQLDLGVKRPALGPEAHLHLLDERILVRPGAQRASLHEHLLAGCHLLLAGRHDVAVAAQRLAKLSRGGLLMPPALLILRVLHHRRWQPVCRRRRETLRARSVRGERWAQHGQDGRPKGIPHTY